MLKFNNLALRRGPRLLFEGANFTIHSGARVGITGANGTGKSSLFALIRDELLADSGDLEMPLTLAIAHVAQEIPTADVSAIEYIIAGDAELHAVQKALQQAESEADGKKQAELHERMAEINGYTARSRAASLMHGLGFTPAEETLSVSSFSGGWRMRLNLAQALMCRSDLLLLDEPTNHLDLDAIIWLGDWLQSYSGTLLLISHDREFLDDVTDHIVHIERRRMRLYRGNYSAFETQRAGQLANQQAAYEKQQRNIRHIQQFVNRFRAKATKAKQAQSRLKALERMEKIALAHVDSPFQFEFQPPEKLPNPLLRLEQVTVGYAGEPVISDVEFSLLPGYRIGLLGPNGAGKSTLIKLLAGELAPMAGHRKPAKELRIGYFAQHQLEQLDVEASPLTHFQRQDDRSSEQELRNYLGGFGFRDERVEEPVALFSGGEKARLGLALLVYQRPNLLLLDEPTNHLDLEMRHTLTLALQNFCGAMVLVSHDRHLIRTVTDDLWVVHKGKFESFKGDLDDYAHWLVEQRRTSAVDYTRVLEHSAATRKARRRAEAEQRQLLLPLRQQARKLEEDIDRLASEKAELDRALVDPAFYEDNAKSRLKELLQKQARVTKALAEAEEAWLDIWENLEAAQAD